MPETAQPADPVAAELAAIHERQENGDLREFAFKDSPRLLAALEAVLKDHAPIPVYASAETCGHERPPEPSTSDGGAYTPWEEWNDDHPSGLDAGGEPTDRICLLADAIQACPACSKLVYETWGDDDRFVPASDCTVRPAISAKLLGPETAPARRG